MCGSFLRLQHDWLSGNSRILHFRTGGTGKEERRRRSVLAGDEGAIIEARLRRTRPPPARTISKNTGYRHLSPSGNTRRKPIFAPASAACMDAQRGGR